MLTLRLLCPLVQMLQLVDETLEMVDLTTLQGNIVGIPGEHAGL